MNQVSKSVPIHHLISSRSIRLLHPSIDTAHSPYSAVRSDAFDSPPWRFVELRDRVARLEVQFVGNLDLDLPELAEVIEMDDTVDLATKRHRQ